MPPKKHRRRCRRKGMCCMPRPRPCVDSLPRHCMPHCATCRPCPSRHTLTSSSSLSTCSCEEEKFCTVDSCKNAAKCITTKMQYCPFGFKDKPDADYQGADRPPGKDMLEYRPSLEREIRTPQAASTPYAQPGLQPPLEYPQGGYPEISTISSPDQFDQFDQSAPQYAQQLPQYEDLPPDAAQAQLMQPDYGEGMMPISPESPVQVRERMMQRPDTLPSPDFVSSGPSVSIRKTPDQYQPYYGQPHDTIPSYEHVAPRGPEEGYANIPRADKQGGGYTPAQYSLGPPSEDVTYPSGLPPPQFDHPQKYSLSAVSSADQMRPRPILQDVPRGMPQYTSSVEYAPADRPPPRRGKHGLVPDTTMQPPIPEASYISRKDMPTRYVTEPPPAAAPPERIPGSRAKWTTVTDGPKSVIYHPPYQPDTGVGAPYQADTRTGAPYQADSRVRVPYQADTRAGAPYQADSRVRVPYQADTRAGAPYQAEVGMGTPRQVDTRVGTPYQAEARTAAPRQVDTRMGGTPYQAEVRSGAPRQVDTRIGTPYQSESRIGTPYQSESRMGTQYQPESRVGTPYQAEVRAGAPRQVDTRMGTPYQAESRMGTPYQAEVRAGAPRQVDTHIGTPYQAESRMGTPYQAESRMGTPYQAEVRAGAPRQVDTRMGTPYQAESRMGTPYQAEVRAGAPRQVDTRMDTPYQAESRMGTPYQAEVRAGAPRQVDTRMDTPYQAESRMGTPYQAEVRAGAPRQVDTRMDTPYQAESRMGTPYQAGQPSTGRPQERERYFAEPVPKKSVTHAIPDTTQTTSYDTGAPVSAIAPDRDDTRTGARKSYPTPSGYESVVGPPQEMGQSFSSSRYPLGRPVAESTSRGSSRSIPFEYTAGSPPSPATSVRMGEPKSTPSDGFHKISYRSPSTGYNKFCKEPPQPEYVDKSIGFEYPVPQTNEYTASGQEEAERPKCSCRYPPAFKHLECAGLMSGTCECNENDL